jgi:SAM-dependent methyltransferase
MRVNMDNGNFLDRHYARHAEEFENDLVDAERIRISNSWFDETTANYWRHVRAYECIELLANPSSASWLTVGDGRWGLDSINIRKKGAKSVHATDISEALLREAKNRGLIDAYSVENAERLTFSDHSFDYVYCKEALHHFPRPWLALYEMLRVARNGVFLFEPNDSWETEPEVPPLAPATPVSPVETATIPPSSRLPDPIRRNLRRSLEIGAPWLLSALRRYRNRRRPSAYPDSSAASQTSCTDSGQAHQQQGNNTGQRPKLRYSAPGWEESGNYVFNISRREIEKIALGLSLPQVVFKGVNDHYVKGCEFEPADESCSAIFREIVSVVRAKDELYRRGLGDTNVLMAGILVHPLDASSRARFAAAGWEVVDLPANPYVARA